LLGKPEYAATATTTPLTTPLPYQANAPTPTSTPEEGVPGFEAAFAIAGLLAMAYLLRRRG
jgi:PGF-CTERM protein